MGENYSVNSLLTSRQLHAVIISYWLSIFLLKITNILKITSNKVNRGLLATIKLTGNHFKP